jgi:hypothetical protein
MARPAGARKLGGRSAAGTCSARNKTMPAPPAMASSGEFETQSTQMAELWPAGAGPSGSPATWHSSCSNAVDCAQNNATEAKSSSQFLRTDFRTPHSVTESGS